MRRERPWRCLFVAACLIVLVVLGLDAQTQARRVGGGLAGQKRSATVKIVAFEEDTGQFLGAPDLLVFKSTNHVDLGHKFHTGVAETIPYGIYQIRAFRSGVYETSERYVTVDQPHVTIVLGMSLSPIEGSARGPLKGKVLGKVLPKESFVKLVELYNGWSSDVGVQADGTFSFSGIPWGRYLILIIGRGGVLASREVSVPYSSPPRPPLVIEIGRDALIPGRSPSTH